ncbi:hypothetical protein SRHO_G00195420 [Serrasalmus rhombeus]
MSRSIHHRVAPQTVQELADALVQVWEEIPQETIRHLIRSRPRRCREVIQALLNPKELEACRLNTWEAVQKKNLLSTQSCGTMTLSDSNALLPRTLTVAAPIACA